MRDIDRTLNLPVEFDVAAYNMGIGGVRRDQRLCEATAGCNPVVWFGHVERTCGATMRLDVGSACATNRRYVRNVVLAAPLVHAKPVSQPKAVPTAQKKETENEPVQPNPASRAVEFDGTWGDFIRWIVRAFTVSNGWLGGNRA